MCLGFIHPILLCASPSCTVCTFNPALCCPQTTFALLLLLQAGVVPSGDAIVSIPSALVALCLNSTGLRRVREMAVLNVLVDVFTCKKTMRVLTSDTPAILGSGLEELLRCGSNSSSSSLCLDLLVACRKDGWQLQLHVHGMG
jgi:hypothetical protein